MTQQSAKSSSNQLAFSGLMLSATIVLLFALLVLCAYAWNLITFPYDYDQGEGFELVDTILFSQGQWPYQNTDSYPFYSSNYPPLYHVIAAPFVWVFGGAYWYGRLLSFVSTLIAAGAIAFAVYRGGNQRWIALLSGLAFLSSNTVYHIAPLVRQHIMMVMFETVAVVMLAYAFQNPKKQTKLIFIALLLIIAAGYTKQLAAITAIAVLLWMILRNPRNGILWSGGFTIVGAIIFIWMNWSTNGEWWRQAIVANVNAFDPFQTFGLTVLWLRLHILLIIPAVLLVLHDIYFSRISLYSAWFVVSVILGAAGSGTWGAGDSYFATAIAAMCILSGIFFSRTYQQTWTFNENYLTPMFRFTQSQQWAKKLIILLIPIVYLGYGIHTFKMPTEGAFFGTIANILKVEPNVLNRHFDSASYAVLGYANIGHFLTIDDRIAGEKITEAIRNTDAPVMSEEAGFSLAAGRDVITNPTQLRNLWLAGLWDGSELLEMVENQDFGLIILRAQFYPVPVLEMIGQHYTVDEVISMNGFEYWLLRPVE